MDLYKKIRIPIKILRGIFIPLFVHSSIMLSLSIYCPILCKIYKSC